MKKPLLFFGAFVLLLFNANAQITITQSDMPTVGKVLVTANDTIYNGISVGASGTNKFWNFSNLLNHTQDTAAFVSPAPLPGASNFPAANLAISGGGISSFISLNSSSLDFLGYYGDFGPPIGLMAIKYNPAFKEITYPSAYLTTFSGTSSSQFKFATSFTPGVDSIKSTISINYTSTIDGWGTITTPAFSNVACLRQYRRDINTTTSYNHTTGGGWTLQPSSGTNPNPAVDTSYSYAWWSNTKKFSLVNIVTNPVGVVTSASYLLIQTATGIEEPTVNNNITISPNPASDFITISGLTEMYAVNIFDVTGKLIESRLLKNSNTSINISGYENGIYFYEVSDKTKNSIGKGKFVVAN